jgi:hypothetical protein
MPNRGLQQQVGVQGGYIRDVPDRTPQGNRRASGFQQRSNGRGNVQEDYEASNDVQGMDEEEDIDIRETRPNGVTPDVPLTKSGYPDRRFLGARHLPPPQEQEIRRARTGGEIDGMHITVTGKPDRRFKENRSLSEEEANQQWAQVLNRRYLQH